MPVTSLPSPYGVGTLGQEARDFASFLAAAGQRVWQLLPIGPTSYGDSPYQSFSAFAGNPYWIDLPSLEQEGLLMPEEYRSLDWGGDPQAVDYGALYEKRYPVLRLAVSRLLAQPPEDYTAFCEENRFWLPDYALFMALKEVHGGASWQDWPEPLRRREEAALAAFRAAHSDALDFWQGVQYLFFHQWKSLKAFVNSLGISLLGDVPIYVAEDSADVWSQPEQFQLDEALLPIEVAGCPPDAFSADGQLWGNPLFDWEAMARDGFSWWQTRIAHQKGIYDLLRIDHFRGLSAYYSIPRGVSAREGRWRQGPGMALIRALEAGPGTQGLIAEDLGYLDEPVRALLRDSGLPGMKVLQFAFDSREESDYLPHNYEHHCVVYTGTHDNDTAAGWFLSAPPDDVAKAKEYLRLSEEEGLHWGLMRGAWSSVGDLAIVQMQDVLGLGSEARMNTPSTPSQNWRWRMLPGAATPELAARLRRQAELYGRI
jgi:4-alpha-glucanotransferase